MIVQPLSNGAGAASTAVQPLSASASVQPLSASTAVQPLSGGVAFTLVQPLSRAAHFAAPPASRPEPPKALDATATEKTAASTEPSNLARIVGFVLT
jgi:hypothetical protein